MTFESNSAESDANSHHLDFHQNSAAIVEKTRQAWITCPEELLPLDAHINVEVGFPGGLPSNCFSADPR